MIHYSQTTHGFDYGSAKVIRLFSDLKKGWVVVGIESKKQQLQIYVTKTGKIRVFSKNGEMK